MRKQIYPNQKSRIENLLDEMLFAKNKRKGTIRFTADVNYVVKYKRFLDNIKGRIEAGNEFWKFKGKLDYFHLKYKRILKWNLKL